MLRIAVLNDSPGAVQSHIDRGHDLDARDEKGRTSLMLAALRGYLNICELLINSGANPLLQDNGGKNAFDIAELNGHSSVMELLRNYLSTYPVGLNDYQKNEFLELSNPLGTTSPYVDLSVWEEDVILPLPPKEEDCLVALLDIHH
jgi:RNA polymerase primary sigma factor